ncbi:cysteine--tRNA ligase [Neolewinella lacunae]|uniref:Cysteine--tRNA ligase n=1 Tax=Neolewinella lacunae TaxID=1517758 RepID=A0A923PM72_9BACT|nr:cysteine--tRNA ligase [Neolewinella lacunae]MBC6995000.1 cysteine--tRNA ligase [Neolewinella lacunae]MDN3633229.1 cysteine--tRNA ligase [Neolewinella lacunae]
MTTELKLHNSLTRQKEVFEPLNAGYVGLYVCGPTVYSDVHLGNCRTFTSFDIIYRYLQYKGYKVRYVRNITDVGHLTDEGEDKMSKGARLAQLEPMEVAQKYTNGFHAMMAAFNNLPPNIEPRATGHIIEQIEMVQTILANGFAYEVNGSVYFDVEAFNARQNNDYGKLSGRRIDELLAESRELKSQDEKRSPTDFAIWMKAGEDHILRWNSPWGEGFPGWHLECSAMSTKYLGEAFDIHGGGNDLKFPHHENEIAQNVGSCGCGGARYWLHTNMLLMNGRKMSKSDGNTITPQQLFTGDSEHVSDSYSPMVLRFFMLQTHYRSTMDLTDAALQAAKKGYQRLMEAWASLGSLQATGGAQNGTVGKEMQTALAEAYAEMDDDFNTPKALAKVFELVSRINALKGGQLSLAEVNASTLQAVRTGLGTLLFDIFGLKEEGADAGAGQETLSKVMDLVLDLRAQARAEKNFAMSDKLRDALNAAGIVVKDGKDGAEWSVG